MKSIKNYKININIPSNVRIEKQNENLIFYGPLGYTLLNLSKLDKTGKGAFIVNKENLIFCSTDKSFFKCMCKIIQGKITGVSNGILLLLRIVGVGYKVEIQHSNSNNVIHETLYFKIGFSHDFKYVIPQSVRIFLLEPTLICIYGIDKNQVTQIAAKIRQIKPPSVYKGKGIRLVNEKVTIKIGKRK